MPDKKLDCQGTNWGPCSGPVSYIDCKGFIYCEEHGLDRRESGIRCRKLRPHELAKLLRSEPVAKY